jgi:thioredoxin-like negative regulator of GroEL
MLERLLILAVIAALIAVGWAGLRLVQRRRLRALAAQRPFADLVPVGSPAIVAFSLPTCGECRARQAPALERLRRQIGTTVHIATLSVDAHPALVERLGVMTVPATAILDAQGIVRAINQGFADEARLRQQLGALGYAV